MADRALRVLIEMDSCGAMQHLLLRRNTYGLFAMPLQHDFCIGAMRAMQDDEARTLLGRRA